MKDEPLSPAHAGATPGGAATPPVASGSVPGPGAKSPAGVPGPKIGEVGYQFRFPVATPEGQEERREHERLRKSVKRAEHARQVVPPALPSASAGAGGRGPSPGDTVQAPAGAQMPDAGGAVTVPTPPPVPWTAELLKDFTDAIIDASEAARQTNIAAPAVEAKFPDAVCKKIWKDSAYPAGPKQTLKISTPRAAAKLLNRTGVSAEHADLIAVVGSMLLIWKQGRSLRAEVEKLLEESKPKDQSARLA